MPNNNFVLLDDICHFEKGTTGLAKAIPGEYPLVTTGANRKTCENFQFDKSAVCIPLVSSTGHGHASLKYVHYQKGKFALGTILVALTSKNENILDIQFLHLYLFQLKNQILVPLMSGAANVSLSIKKIKKIEIPLPSIERQKQIVNNFNLIEMEDKELRKELIHQETILKKLRQQILQEAIKGKLTQDWRKENPDVESASELLKRIKLEKAHLIKEKEIKKQKLLPPITEDERTFEITENWKWCRLGEICEIKGGKRVPSGHSLKNEITPYKYARVLNLFDNTIKGDIKFLSEDAWLKVKRYEISKDNLYVTIAGTIGRSGTVPEEHDKIILTENSSKLCFYLMIPLLKTFLALCLNSSFIQDQFKKKVYGMAMPKLALKRIKTTRIPLPPLSEQKVIAVKVEKLFAICDELEKEINENKIHSEQLMQSVLREAFEGTESV